MLTSGFCPDCTMPEMVSVFAPADEPSVSCRCAALKEMSSEVMSSAAQRTSSMRPLLEIYKSAIKVLSPLTDDFDGLSRSDWSSSPEVFPPSASSALCYF